MAQPAIGGDVDKKYLIKINKTAVSKMDSTDLNIFLKKYNLIAPAKATTTEKKQILKSFMGDRDIYLPYDDVKIIGKTKIADIDRYEKMIKMEQQEKELQEKGMEAEKLRFEVEETKKKEKELRTQIEKLEKEEKKTEDKTEIERIKQTRDNLIKRLKQIVEMREVVKTVEDTMLPDEEIRIVKKDFVDKSIDKMSKDLTTVPDYWVNPYSKKLPPKPKPKPNPKKTFSEEKKEQRDKEIKEEKEAKRKEIKDLKQKLKEAKTKEEYNYLIDLVKTIEGESKHLYGISEGKKKETEKGRGEDDVDEEIESHKNTLKIMEEEKAKRFESLLMHPVDREEVQRQDINFKHKTGEKIDSVDDALRYPVVNSQEAKKKKTEDQMTSKSNGLNLEARISNMRKFQSLRDNVIKKSALKSGYVSTDEKMKMLKRSVF